VDDLIVGSVLSTGAVATVTVAFRIPAVLMSVARTAFSGVFPYSADLAGRSDTAAVARLLIYGTRLALILTMLSLIAFWYVGPLLLELWVGSVADGATLLRLGLVLNVVFNGVVVVELALYGWGEMRTLAIITMLGSLVNLPLTLVLTHTVGLAGPLLGTMAGGAVIAVLSVERAARLIDCSVLAFWREAVFGPVAAIGPVVLALLLARMVVGPGTLQVLGLTGIGMAMYLACALTISFSAEDRGRSRELVRLAVRQFSLRAHR
jgi:O-antigen/teichoic acid export membrane protein